MTHEKLRLAFMSSFPCASGLMDCGLKRISLKLGPLIFGALVKAGTGKVLSLRNWEFFFYNEAEQLQFSLQLGNARLCASCHPVLIWALMYFINKGLLSSLTVVTP